MDKRTTKQVYREAIRKWGLPSQFNMLMEECAELIQAVSKVIRYDNPADWNNLAEEMADVENMIDQIKISCNWQFLEEKVNTKKHEKLLRLQKMLENNK